MRHSSLEFRHSSSSSSRHEITGGSLDPGLQLALRERPTRRAIGHHRWSNLAFLHWRVPADKIAPLLPPGLTLDTWNGDAWVGLVPFSMSGVRPWWSPSVPGVSNFAETNVRTYVHHQGTGPGVWFFSLDAASSLAVRIARWRWNLNYFRADMALRAVSMRASTTAPPSMPAEAERVRYASTRRWPGPPGALTEIDLELAHDKAPTAAQPGTLEFFLLERYLMYMQRADGRLRGGRVWHVPYPLRHVSDVTCRETLLAANGISVSGPPDHVAYSPGVSVEIFAPRDVA